jgi:hypothetical protein
MFRNASLRVWALLVVAVVLVNSARAAEPISPRVWDNLASDDPATRAQAIAVLEAAGPQAVAFLRERLKPVTTDARRIDALIKQLDSDDFEQREQATEELEYHGKIARPQLETALASKPPLEVRRRIEQVLERIPRRVVTRAEIETLREALPKLPGRERDPDWGFDPERAALAAAEGHKILFVTRGGIEMTPRQVMASVGPERAAELLAAARMKANGPREVAAPPVPPPWVRASAAIRILERVGNNEAQDLLRMVAGGAEDALPTVQARGALERLKVNASP